MTVCQSIDQLECVEEYKMAWDILNVIETCSGVCPALCSTYSFHSTLSSASYPTEYYAKKLKEIKLIKGVN